MAVTIKDVAKRAGVSTATVSKIMNHNPSISEATTQRVQEIMHQMQYQPNQLARNFAKRATRTIVLAMKFEKNTAFENPHIFEIMTGLQKVLSEKSYSLQLVHVTQENCLEVLGNIMAQKSADALVLHISAVTKDLEKSIRQKEFPHIVLGCPEFRTQLCWIDNNNVLSGEMAAAYLHRIGCRRIAFIGGKKQDIGSMHRLQGYKNVLEQRHITFREEYIVIGDSTVDNGRKMMNQLYQLPHKPDSVICANNNLALGAMKELQSKGVTLPSQMQLITFDKYPFSFITEPKISTVNIDVYDMGKQAGEIILKKIKKPNLQIQSYTTLASLQIQGTTK